MKKFNFSKKRKMQVYVIITSLMLCTLACIFSSLNVYAVDNINVSELYGWNTLTLGINGSWNKSEFRQSSLFDNNRDLVIDSLNMSDNLDYSNIMIYFDGDSSNGEYTLPLFFTFENVTYNINEFPYFILRYNSSNNQYRLQILQDVSNLVGNNGNFTTTNQSYFDNFVGFTFKLNANSDAELLGRVGKDSGRAPQYYSPIYATTGFIFCNFPMYTVDLNGITNTTELIKSYISNGYIEYWYALSGSENGQTYGNYEDIKSDNINYLLTDSNGGNGYTNPITNESYDSISIGNVSSEQFDNYEYLTGASGIYPLIENTDSGKVQFCAQVPTGMDTDKYYLKFSGSCTYQVTVKSATDQKTRDVLRYYVDVPNPIGVSGLTRTVSASGGSGNVAFSYLSSDGIYNADMGLINSMLYANSGSPMSTLAEYLENSNILTIRGYIGSLSGLGMSASAGSYGSFGYSVPQLNVVNADKFDVNAINYTFTMALYTDENEKVGEMSKTVNLISGETSDGANTLTVSNDDVLNNTTGGTDYYNHTASPSYNNSNSGGNSSSSGGSSNSNSNSNIESGAVVINNNPTFNNDVSSKSSSAGLGSNLISTILGYIIGSKGSSVDAFEEIADADGWKSVIISAYTFVPVQFWNLLFSTFTILLGILVVTFIISIVIKIIT